MSNTTVIILAAGEGKRMAGGDTPKPLQLLQGKPFIKYLLDSITASGVCDRPTIVVGHLAETIKQFLGDVYDYVLQEERLGTGHAVKVCKDTVAGTAENVIVFYADHPFITPETIKTLEQTHVDADATISMMTVVAPDFDEWRAPFASYGRVKRDIDGSLVGIIEAKDATPEERSIMEVSPSFFCFKSEWLFDNLEKLENKNAQSEYYLTDLVQMALSQDLSVASVVVDPKVAIGINSPEDLEIATEVLGFAK